jgi:hypothetical protein
MLRFQSPPSVSQKGPVNEPPPDSPTGAPMERVARFTCLSNSSTKVFLIKRYFTLLSKALGKSLRPCSPRRGPYGNRHTFPEPYLAYPSGSPVKEPSLQVPLIEVPQRQTLRFQSPPSFIFQSPRYTSPLLGSPAGPLWREMPVSRKSSKGRIMISRATPKKLEVKLAPFTCRQARVSHEVIRGLKQVYEARRQRLF